MKWIIRIIGLLVAIVVLLAVLQTLASERVEVVELVTQDAEGNAVTTRLWVVDDEGFQYLRGDAGSGWMQRLENSPQFTVTRGESTVTYTTVLRPEKADRINELMQEKYTWGDTFFSVMLGDNRASIPVELHPVGQE